MEGSFRFKTQAQRCFNSWSAHRNQFPSFPPPTIHKIFFTFNMEKLRVDVVPRPTPTHGRSKRIGTRLTLLLAAGLATLVLFAGPRCSRLLGWDGRSERPINEETTTSEDDRMNPWPKVGHSLFLQLPLNCWLTKSVIWK